MSHQLAQFNIARLRFPLDAPEARSFIEGLEPVNAGADEAPGFVWRLQTDDGDATGIRAFEDDMVLINLSVWETLEDFRSFVFASPHLEYMQRREEWFEQISEAYAVLWWVPAEHIPTIEEALEKLRMLRDRGPNSEAFSMLVSYRPDGSPIEQD